MYFITVVWGSPPGVSSYGISGPSAFSVMAVRIELPQLPLLCLEDFKPRNVQKKIRDSSEFRAFFLDTDR